MADVDNRYANKQTERPVSRATILQCVAVIVFVLIVCQILLGSYAGNRLRHTCAVCRLNRVDYTSRLLGTTKTTYDESDCSVWYQTNVEAEHGHIWVRSPTMALLDFYGQTIGVGDNEETPGRVIWRLSSKEQIDIYKHASDPMEARHLFESLAEPTSQTENKDFEILHSLREWIDSGFAGDWKSPVEL